MQSRSKMIRETNFSDPYPKLPPSIDVGDRVAFKNLRTTKFRNGYTMVVDEVRVMLARNDDTGGLLRAYTVEFPSGERGEYDETQLVKVEECVNCDDTVLYPDEQCPDCGRQE